MRIITCKLDPKKILLRIEALCQLWWDQEILSMSKFLKLSNFLIP